MNRLSFTIDCECLHLTLVYQESDGCPEPSTNINCALAEMIDVIPFNTTGDTSFVPGIGFGPATQCYGIEAESSTVWYEMAAVTERTCYRATVVFEDYGYGTLATYKGTSCSNLTCWYDFEGGDTASAYFDVTPGERSFIVVADRPYDTKGPFSLEVDVSIAP